MSVESYSKNKNGVSVRRLVINLSWDKYWDEMEKIKLYETLDIIARRIDALEKKYFPNQVVIEHNGKEEIDSVYVIEAYVNKEDEGPQKHEK